MTVKEAYGIICKEYNDYPTVTGGYEYKDIYAFFLAPAGTKKGEPAFVGGSMHCVNKESGEVSQIPVYKMPKERPRPIVIK